MCTLWLRKVLDWLNVLALCLACCWPPACQDTLRHCNLNECDGHKFSKHDCCLPMKQHLLDTFTHISTHTQPHCLYTYLFWCMFIKVCNEIRKLRRMFGMILSRSATFLLLNPKKKQKQKNHGNVISSIVSNSLISFSRYTCLQR